MEMRRTGLMVFLAAAMLVALSVLAAFAGDDAMGAAGTKVATGANAATTPALCPPVPPVVGLPGEPGPATAQPSRAGCADLWHSAGRVGQIQGRVAWVEEVHPYPGSPPDLRVALRVSPEDVDATPDWQLPAWPQYWIVQLGPAWFVQQGLGDVRVGDLVTVTGAPVRWQGQQVILAQKVRKDGRWVAFRSDVGIPVWTAAGPSRGRTMEPARASSPGLYDPGTVQTVSGHLDRIWAAETVPGLGQDRLISVRQADRSSVLVDLAPASFLAARGVRLRVGDEVVVIGSRVVRNGRPMLLATRLEEGRRQFTLRDSGGNPVWALAMAIPSVTESEARLSYEPIDPTHPEARTPGVPGDTGLEIY